jgi:hypothetical protein
MTMLSIRILGAWLMSAVLLVGSCLVCLTPNAEGASHDCCRAAAAKNHCDPPSPSEDPAKESKDCPNEKLFLETAKKQDTGAGVFVLHPDFMAPAPASLREAMIQAGPAMAPRAAPFELALILRI